MASIEFYRKRFNRLMLELHPTIVALGVYEDSRTTKMKFKCLVCGNVWYNKAGQVVGQRKSGCPKCGYAKGAKDRQKITLTGQEEAMRKCLAGTNTNIVKRIDSDYFLLKCKCGYTWEAFRSSIKTYKRGGCRKCANASVHKEITQETISRIYARGAHEYIKSVKSDDSILECKCAECGSVFRVSLMSLRKSSNQGSCKACAVRASLAASKRRVKIVKFGKKEFRVTGYEPEALKYLINNLGISPRHISDKPPHFQYTYSSVRTKYIPDFFISESSTVVEVKCPYTMGLRGKMFGMNVLSRLKAKARAVEKAGMKFLVLVVDKRNTKIAVVKMPKDWHLYPAKRIRKSTLDYIQKILRG